MKDSLTLANINIFSILRNLEDLCELDKDIKALIKDKNISIQFNVKNGPSALLIFKDGECELQRGNGKCDIKLFFKSPEHFNAMFEGKANPIPLKGFTKIGFLKNEFTTLTDKLGYYLKPTEDLLKDKDYFKINTILTFYAAFFALAEIGDNDGIGRLSAKRIPDGKISISVSNGPALFIEAKGGYLKASKGLLKSPRASMSFEDLDCANLLLNGKIDSYSCMASGGLKMNGFIPMIDNLNKLLGQVPEYLS
jgi:putative sterol carrier protein